MSTNANRELAERFLWAMLSSDRETMMETLSADTTWYPPTYVQERMGPVEGREAVMAFLCDNPEKFYERGSRTMDLHAVIAEGDYVAARFDFKARPLRGGFLTTGANFMFRISDGEIRETWEVLCTVAWQQAVMGEAGS